MSKKKGKSSKELELEYLEIEGLAKRFAGELTKQANILIDEENIALGLPIEARVKTWISISEKLERVRLKLHHITDLQDLVGLRLIFLFRRDAEKACQIIENRFAIIKQENTQGRLKHNQFGYTSVHFVIKFPQEWLVVPAFSSFKDLKAEVQVRTMSQHLWASASHVLQYKNEMNVPEPVKRSIYRASALLETIDLEFERVLEERSIYRKELSLDSLGDILNRDSVELLLDSLLPIQNKSFSEDYDDLLVDLKSSDINSPELLTSLINENLDSALKADKNRVREEIANGIDNVDIFVDAERLNQGVFYTHAGLVRHMLHMF